METIPTNISQADERTMQIDWSDGTQSRYDVFDLRVACPCANCVDEMTGKRLLDPATVDKNVKPKSIYSVGNYAMQIQWSDGHDTGIYSWKRLKALDS